VTRIQDDSEGVSAFHLSVLNIERLIKQYHLLHIKRIVIISIIYSFIGDSKKLLSPTNKVVHNSAEVGLCMSSASFFKEFNLKISCDFF
jgi:hypothetical protein